MRNAILSSVFLIAVASQLANAGNHKSFVDDGYQGCGLYEIRGHIDLKQSTLVINVYKGTSNSISLVISGTFQPNAQFYRDNFVAILATLKKQPSHYSEINPTQIDLAVPDPLHPASSEGLHLLSKCK